MDKDILRSLLCFRLQRSYHRKRSAFRLYQALAEREALAYRRELLLILARNAEKSAISHHDLNLRGVFLHGIADAGSSIGVILAAGCVYFFNWLWADAVASLLVALFLSISAISLIKDSLRQFQLTCKL
ncbi:cation transporter [Nostoc sp.]